MIILFYMAFTKWSAFGAPEVVGLKNFERLIGDSSFHTALFNTIYYSGVHIPLTLVTSLSLALLLNKKLRGVAFFRTAAFFPYIASIVAVAAVWNQLFSANGVINQVLDAIGIGIDKGWTSDATLAMPALIIVSVWRDTGYFMLLYLAGLQTVPPELHEAARTDGANAWQRFWNVTWPCLRPTTFFVTVILTIQSLKVLDLVLLLTARRARSGHLCAFPIHLHQGNRGVPVRIRGVGRDRAVPHLSWCHGGPIPRQQEVGEMSVTTMPSSLTDDPHGAPVAASIPAPHALYSLWTRARDTSSSSPHRHLCCCRSCG